MKLENIIELERSLFSNVATKISKQSFIRLMLPFILVLKDRGASWNYISEKITMFDKTLQMSNKTLKIYFYKELKKVENDPEFLRKVDLINQEYERNLYQKNYLLNK